MDITKIKAELKRRHDAGKASGDDRFYLDVLEVITDLQAEIEDIRLELSCPETSGMDDKPLYVWAAVINCEKLRLQTEVACLQKDEATQIMLNQQLQAELALYRWRPVAEELPERTEDIEIVYKGGKKIHIFHWEVSYTDTKVFRVKVAFWRPAILPKDGE